MMYMWTVRQITYTLVGLGNVFFLAFSVFLMYHRIEIQHPIYAVLFCDLCLTFGLAAIDFIVICLNDLELLARVVSPSVMLSLFFLSSIWLVIATLRYLYIVKADWLHTKYPDESKIRTISIWAVFLIFTLFVAIGICVCSAFGWPKKRLTALNDDKKILFFSALSATYASSLVGATIIYLLVLRHRWKQRINQVSNDQELDQRINESQFGEVEEEKELRKRESERIQAEINSAYKSLGTNIVISASLPFLSFLAYFFSADYFVILFIVSKTVISITTIIVNFGPIKQLVRSVVSLNKQDI